MQTQVIQGEALTAGSARGPVLFSDTALSFWGGVAPTSGEVIDRHHPLSGQIITGKVLAIPKGRGSCTGSSVLMEVILNGNGPSALVLEQTDEILALGAIVAELVFGHALPVVTVGSAAFARLRDAVWAEVLADGQVRLSEQALPASPPSPSSKSWSESAAKALALSGAPTHIQLSAQDQEILAGGQGKARQVAMQIVLRMAGLQGASEFIDVVQAHIDGCIYTGSASLRFAQQLCAWGAQVKVPTTLNSISVDQRRWRALGIDPVFGEPASALGQAYVDMGAQASYTCAPYLLDTAPLAGEHIVWAESNAVVYANSVLGAYTAKCADFLDICIALTGRAPKAGCHLRDKRYATLRIEVPAPAGADDTYYPLLGYHIGLLCGAQIPVLCGLQNAALSSDDLKAFGAAFATSSAAPMFHIVGATPEAPDATTALGGKAPLQSFNVSLQDLQHSWRELSSSAESAVDLVALGNPHFSATECHALARLLQGRQRHPDTQTVLTLGRAVKEQARANGDIAVLEAFGVNLITDTCWCMLDEPVVPVAARVIMTNSGKYAHYAPGLTGRQVHFGSLAACAQTACTGQAPAALPAWLVNPPALKSAAA
jgi:predicted aconitase/predicted aconitase with swiveling domain